MSITQWTATATVPVQWPSTRHSDGHRLTDYGQIYVKQWTVCNSWAAEQRRSVRTRTLHAAQIIKLPHADNKVKTRKPFAVRIRNAQRNCKGICEVPGLNPGTETAYSDSFAKLPSESPDNPDDSKANYDTNNSFPTLLRRCVQSVY
jgi:hypothetical protein